jgi:hypothetical protein
MGDLGERLNTGGLSLRLLRVLFRLLAGGAFVFKLLPRACQLLAQISGTEAVAAGLVAQFASASIGDVVRLG